MSTWGPQRPSNVRARSDPDTIAEPWSRNAMRAAPTASGEVPNAFVKTTLTRSLAQRQHLTEVPLRVCMIGSQRQRFAKLLFGVRELTERSERRAEAVVRVG